MEIRSASERQLGNPPAPLRWIPMLRPPLIKLPIRFPSFSQEGLFQGADLGPLPSTAYSPFGTAEMDIIWGNANMEVTSAPPPTVTSAPQEGVATKNIPSEELQAPVPEPIIPDPPVEVPTQSVQGDAQETATQAPAEGVSEEGEIAAELPSK